MTALQNRYTHLPCIDCWSHAFLATTVDCSNLAKKVGSGMLFCSYITFYNMWLFRILAMFISLCHISDIMSGISPLGHFRVVPKTPHQQLEWFMVRPRVDFCFPNIIYSLASSFLVFSWTRLRWSPEPEHLRVPAWWGDPNVHNSRYH